MRQGPTEHFGIFLAVRQLQEHIPYAGYFFLLGLPCPLSAMTRYKRPIEVFDISSDEEDAFMSLSQELSSQDHGRHRASKHPRTNYNQRTAFGSSQYDAIYVDDDADDGSQEAPGSSQGYDERQYSYVLYGSMQSKIVGVRYVSNSSLLRATSVS